jgi:hypothetical protein
MITERDWRALYAWLGRQIEDAASVANKLMTPDRDSLALSQRADALASVRTQMRIADPSLRVARVDER